MNIRVLALIQVTCLLRDDDTHYEENIHAHEEAKVIIQTLLL